MMRPLLVLSALLCPLLAACSLEPIINHQVVDYFEANDIASNQVILQNILRAKDGAPLHFSELANIRGSLSSGASASATFPFMGPDHATTLPRKLGTVGVTISSSPSFDIDSLDTQDFTNGVMRPITPETAQFFLNEGIDYRMVLLLLVSGVRSAGSPEMLLNAPNSSRIVCYKETPGTNAVPFNYTIAEADDSCPGKSEPEFYAFLRTINNLGRIYPLSVTKSPKPVGSPFDLDMSKSMTEVAKIDPSHYRLVQLKPGKYSEKYRLLSEMQGSDVVLCQDVSGDPVIVGILDSERDESTPVRSDACSRQRGTAAYDDQTGITQQTVVGDEKGTVVFKLRSTLEVIEYVGQILALQQEETEENPQLPERCVTLEYENYKDGKRMTCNYGVLFHLQRSAAGLSSPLTTVSYNGVSWSLPAPRVCKSPTQCDHTLETISVISLLLNQNKSSKDIAKTQAVQVVP
jgi:hypothetical protein